MANLLLRHREIADLHKIDVYEKHGGYDGLKKALAWKKKMSSAWFGIQVCVVVVGLVFPPV